MTFKAVYRDAAGNQAAVGDLDVFLALFDQPDLEIWVGETGDFGIWRESETGIEQEMILSYVPNAGFTIHSEDSEGRVRIACAGRDKTTVSFHVGGMREKRSRRSFLNPELARAVVREFIVTGDRETGVDWLRLGET